MMYKNRLPEKVTAFEVLAVEMQAVADWCGGEVMVDVDDAKYILLNGENIYPDGIMILENNGAYTVMDNELFDNVYDKI